LFHHIPVLTAEIITGLQITPGGRYLDATTGGGGHSSLILQADSTLHLVAIDRDPMALAAARAYLQPYGDRVTFWAGNYADYPADQPFDGIIADLGVSSAQLDLPERGFSFRHEAPLDMRMDGTQNLTAAEIINHWAETDIAHVLYHYGEERLSRQIARRIVEKRPLYTTTALAEVISYAVPKSYRFGRIHPATRSFQGLRIAVNQELSSLERFLALSPPWLVEGGRIGIISFHSLEDRMVKHFWRDRADLQVITKKPIIAGAAEVAANPRARSAKLRWAMKGSGPDESPGH
jgi:16S rRNA (cytosine1402-N4)-methyltransferase